MARCIFLLAGFCLLGTLMGCTTTSMEPFTIAVPEMGFCSDWDVANNRPSGKAAMFSPDTPRIYVYARVEADEEFYYVLDWYYVKGTHGDEHLLRQTVKPEKCYIVAWIEPPEGKVFQVGKYAVILLWGKSTLRTAEFEVR